MTDRKPLVSIGMPVYNGGNFIRSALESLLAQDYENFELIISDNHSTDSTQEICSDYMIRDKRIRYFRNETNEGAVRNFTRVFELSQGEYFMWAAHDDYREPNYIRLCVELMENNPKVILCCSRIIAVNENGDAREIKENFHTIGMVPYKRFHKMLWANSCAIIYGLIRRNGLRKKNLFNNTIGSDNLLLAELSLKGEFYQFPLFLFRKRIRSNNIFEKIKIILESNFPDSRQAFFSPFSKMAIEYFKLVHYSNLRGKEKILAYLDIIFCYLLKYKIFLSDPAFTIYLNLSRVTK